MKGTLGDGAEVLDEGRERGELVEVVVIHLLQLLELRVPLLHLCLF